MVPRLADEIDTFQFGLTQEALTFPVPLKKMFIKQLRWDRPLSAELRGT